MKERIESRGTRWRLLPFQEHDPAWNMAVDEALLQTAGEVPDEAIPTLRLYGWRPPALSLGANQQGGDAVDWKGLARQGYGVVRRSTGGRAILHAQELTYSVTAPAPPGGTLAAYRWIAGGLQQGLARAGIAVTLERARRPAAEGIAARHPCFSAAGRYELTAAGGRKMVGSAQRRRSGWIMQHGSILTGPRHLDLPRFLVGIDAAKEMHTLRQVTVDCSQLVKRSVDAAWLAPLLAEGFAAGLELRLEPGTLTPREEQRARHLLKVRFGTLRWTRDGLRSAVVKPPTRERQPVP